MSSFVIIQTEPRKKNGISGILLDFLANCAIFSLKTGYLSMKEDFSFELLLRDEVQHLLDVNLF